MNGVSFGVGVSTPEKMTEKEDWLSLMKGFEREEIVEVLSRCQVALLDGAQSVANRKRTKKLSMSSSGSSLSDDIHERCSESSSEGIQDDSRKSDREPNNSPRTIDSGSRKRYADKFSLASVGRKHLTSSTQSKPTRLLDDGTYGLSLEEDEMLYEEQKERPRFTDIGRKKDFVHFERINGKRVNVLQGLELHTQVFNAEEQKKIVEYVYEFQRMGQKKQLRERTYTEPSKWMRGKGRVTIQFGCCYNYAVDKNGNPPGIIREEEVDPLPPIFIQMIKRMVRWHVLPPTCVPNSCIVNIYEEGDCIPPHIDHHDFLRPFCTISFLTECNILFGSNLKIIGPGEFAGPVSIPLPVGSVLVLKGNGADVAKHCVPAVPAKRISITFRKMDEGKIPYHFSPDPGLRRVQPLALSPSLKTPLQQKQIETKEATPPPPPASRVASRPNGPSFIIGDNDLPPLGVVSGSRQRGRTKTFQRLKVSSKNRW